MREGEQKPGCQPAPVSAVQTHPPPSTTTCSPAFLFYFNTYCSEFLEVSNLLNQELLRNNNLITGRLAPPPAAAREPSDGKKDS